MDKLEKKVRKMFAEGYNCEQIAKEIEDEYNRRYDEIEDAWGDTYEWVVKISEIMDIEEKETEIEENNYHEGKLEDVLKYGNAARWFDNYEYGVIDNQDGTYNWYSQVSEMPPFAGADNVTWDKIPKEFKEWTDWQVYKEDE